MDINELQVERVKAHNKRAESLRNLTLILCACIGWIWGGANGAAWTLGVAALVLFIIAIIE